MGRARGANALMNLAFETAYGVPPTSGYLRMPFVSSQLGATQNLIESDLLGQGRAPFDPTYDVVNNDGDVVVPLDTIRLGYWLKLLFGAPITDTSGIPLHVFRSGAQSLPPASIEIGHRGWNAHPDGGDSGLAGSPARTRDSRPRSGMESTSAWV